MLLPQQQRILFNPAYIICAISVLLLATGSGFYHHHLWFTDEARVGGIIAQMVHTGNYVTPYIGTEPFVEKPPLYFAFAAKLVEFFQHHISPPTLMRFSSVFWGLGTLIATYGFTRVLVSSTSMYSINERQRKLLPLLSVLILAATPGFISNSLTVRVDIALAFFNIAFAWGLASAILTGRNLGLYGAAMGLAGAFLTKGFIAIMFAGCSYLALLPWQKSWRTLVPPTLQKKHIVGAIVLLLFITGVWAVAFYRQAGAQLWQEWFLRNNILRFLGTSDLGHEGDSKPFYYISALGNYGFPWIFLVFLQLIQGLRFPRKLINPQSIRFITAISFWLPVIILSLAQTKRPVYLLPILPFFATVAAVYLLESFSPWLQKSITLTTWLLVILGDIMISIPALQLMPWPSSQWAHLSLPTDSWAWCLVVLTILGGIALALFLLPPSQHLPLLILAVMALCIIFNTLIYASRDEEESGYQQLTALAQSIPSTPHHSTLAVDFPESLTSVMMVYDKKRLDNITAHKAAMLIKDQQLINDYLLIYGEDVLSALPEQRYHIVATSKATKALPSIYLVQVTPGSTKVDSPD